MPARARGQALRHGEDVHEREAERVPERLQQRRLRAAWPPSCGRRFVRRDFPGPIVWSSRARRSASCPTGRRRPLVRPGRDLAPSAELTGGAGDLRGEPGAQVASRAGRRLRLLQRLELVGGQSVEPGGHPLVLGLYLVTQLLGTRRPERRRARAGRSRTARRSRTGTPPAAGGRPGSAHGRRAARRWPLRWHVRRRRSPPAVARWAAASRSGRC